MNIYLLDKKLSYKPLFWIGLTLYTPYAKVTSQTKIETSSSNATSENLMVKQGYQRALYPKFRRRKKIHTRYKTKKYTYQNSYLLRHIIYPVICIALLLPLLAKDIKAKKGRQSFEDGFLRLSVTIQKNGKEGIVHVVMYKDKEKAIEKAIENIKNTLEDKNHQLCNICYDDVNLNAGADDNPIMFVCPGSLYYEKKGQDKNNYTGAHSICKTCLERFKEGYGDNIFCPTCKVKFPSFLLERLQAHYKLSDRKPNNNPYGNNGDR